MLIERLLRRVMEFRCKITEQRHLVANYSMQRGRVDSVAGGWLVNKFITQLSNNQVYCTNSLINRKQMKEKRILS